MRDTSMMLSPPLLSYQELQIHKYLYLLYWLSLFALHLLLQLLSTLCFFVLDIFSFHQQSSTIHNDVTMPFMTTNYVSMFSINSIGSNTLYIMVIDLSPFAYYWTFPNWTSSKSTLATRTSKEWKIVNNYWQACTGMFSSDRAHPLQYWYWLLVVRR